MTGQASADYIQNLLTPQTQPKAHVVKATCVLLLHLRHLGFFGHRCPYTRDIDATLHSARLDMFAACEKPPEKPFTLLEGAPSLSSAKNMRGS